MILAAAAWLLAEVLVAVLLTFLRVDRIKAWFENYDSETEANKYDARLTLYELLANGKHRVVYGMFNTSKSTFTAGESVIADEIDSAILDMHAGRVVVIHG